MNTELMKNLESMRDTLHTIHDTLYAIRTFRHLNNEKVWLFKGKTTKNATSFMQNKPNSPIVQMNASLFTAMNYAIFASLTKVKNKPNQTQSNPIKPNSNPIQTQSPKGQK